MAPIIHNGIAKMKPISPAFSSTSTPLAKQPFNFYLSMLCLSGFLDLFGVSLVVPFLPKHLKGLGETYTTIGIVTSIYGFLQFFSSPLVGNLSDRFGRKYILITSLCCTGVSYLLMTTSFLSASLVVVAVSRIPPGLLKHSQSLTRAEIAHFPKASSYFNAASTTGFIVGPPLTGILMDKFAPRIGYSVAGQLAAVAFFLNALLVYCALPKDVEEAKQHHHRNNKTGLQETLARLSTPPFRSIYVAKFLNSQAMFLLRCTFLLYLEIELQLSSSVLGWLNSVSPILTVAFAPLVTPVCSYFAEGSPRLQAVCCLFEILSCLLLLVAPNAIFVVLAAIPHGFSAAVGRVNYTSLSLFFGGGATVGTLIGLDQSVLAFSRTIAPTISGLLMDFSLRLPFAIAILLLLPTALIFEGLGGYTTSKKNVLSGLPHQPSTEKDYKLD